MNTHDEFLCCGRKYEHRPEISRHKLEHIASGYIIEMDTARTRLILPVRRAQRSEPWRAGHHFLRSPAELLASHPPVCHGDEEK